MPHAALIAMMTDLDNKQYMHIRQIADEISQVISSITTMAKPAQKELYVFATRFTSPITNLYEAFIPPNADRRRDVDNQTEDALYNLWGGILTAVVETPPIRQDQLSLIANLLWFIQQHPNPQVPDTDRRAKLEQAGWIPWSDDKGELWSRLCMFGWTTREYFDGAYDTVSSSDKSYRDRWHSLNFFLATVTAEGVSDETFLGLAVLRQVLEGENWGGVPSQAGKKALLLAAASWLILCADRWWRDGWGDAAGDVPGSVNSAEGSLWQDGPALRITQKRVLFWRDRIGEFLAGQSPLDEECTRTLHEAAAVLDSTAGRIDMGLLTSKKANPEL